MTKLMKISLIALALCGTAAYAETDYSASTGDASSYGFQDSSAFRPGRPGRPGRPDWRPGRPGRRMHSCVARDIRGFNYYARGFANVNRVAREALRHCRFNSRFPGTCRVMGCR